MFQHFGLKMPILGLNVEVKAEGSTETARERVVELTERKLTVGKIYAGLLIAENWKSYKATGKTGVRTTVRITLSL